MASRKNNIYYSSFLETGRQKEIQKGEIGWGDYKALSVLLWVFQKGIVGFRKGAQAGGVGTCRKSQHLESEGRRIIFGSRPS